MGAVLVMSELWIGGVHVYDALFGGGVGLQLIR